MSRLARIVIPGCPHHVTQRGNHHQTVFFTDGDRRVYLEILRDHCRSHGVRVLAYCLMTNHVHLVAVPEREESLARTFGRTHNEYARWMHVRERQVGHLWQNRFYSCPLEQRRLRDALRYVELNPVRAGLVQEAWEWRWSSAEAHLRNIEPLGFLDMAWWRQWQDKSAWKEVLQSGYLQAALTERLREATRTGRPWGGPEFVAELENRLGRSLAPLKRGPRPRVLGAAP